MAATIGADDLDTSPQDPSRYPRAAARWLARFCDEGPAVTLDEAELAATHLGALRGESAAVAGYGLREIFAGAGRAEFAQVVRRWESQHVRSGHLAHRRISS